MIFTAIASVILSIMNVAGALVGMEFLPFIFIFILLVHVIIESKDERENKSQVPMVIAVFGLIFSLGMGCTSCLMNMTVLIIPTIFLLINTLRIKTK